MKIEEIDKWLDNEYGVSYTRLEELHDFVVEQDMKHQEEAEKEIERLNEELKQAKEIALNEHKYASEMEDKYITANNIINELEHDFESYELEYLQETYQGSLADFIEKELERIQELKGSDK